VLSHRPPKPPSPSDGSGSGWTSAREQETSDSTAAASCSGRALGARRGLVAGLGAGELHDLQDGGLRRAAGLGREALLSKLDRDLLIADAERQRRTDRRRRSPTLRRSSPPVPSRAPGSTPPLRR
jgi:hypothetical protein